MIIAFSFVGLRLDSKRTSHSEDGGEHNSEKDHHDRFQLDTHIDCPNEIDSKGPEDDPDKDAGSRFSWHPRKASLTPGQVINLPLPRRNTPAKQASRKSGDPEEDDDEGEFGTAPVPVSLGGLAKILGAGIICGGGVAAMREFYPPISTCRADRLLSQTAFADYVGQVSINSVPRVTNTAYMVFLSILIAMGAVTLGLFLLFVVLRPKLQHAWYKRLGVAMTLGAGTTAMHFGTSFEALEKLYNRTKLSASTAVALLGTHFYVVEGETLIAGGASSKHLISTLSYNSWSFHKLLQLPLIALPDRNANTCRDLLHPSHSRPRLRRRSRVLFRSPRLHFRGSTTSTATNRRSPSNRSRRRNF